MNRRNVILIVTLVALFLVGGYSLMALRKHRQMEALRNLQADVFSEATRKLPEEERREKYKQFRAEYEQLSEAQRREFRKNQSAGPLGRANNQIRKYFELPQSERLAFLDQQINEMEKRRRSMAGRTGGETKTTRLRGGRGPDRGDRRDNLTDSEKQDRRDRFRRGFLDGTTPQQRAEMSAYMEALRKRREERGLPDVGHRRRSLG